MKTILVVEDEALLLQAIARKLKNSGYEPITVTSRNQAVDYLESMDKPVDAIWMDYYLGETNGLELLQDIKKNEKWKNIPVVVVSNSANEDTVTSMLALGANKYMLKAQNKLDEIISAFDEFIAEEKKGE
jgi:CheY-like chemotaxis protein